MTNYFDQFDGEPVNTPAPKEIPNASAPQTGNFFDQFDEPAAQPEDKDRGFINNGIRGAGKFINDMGAGIVDLAGTAAVHMPGGVIGTPAYASQQFQPLTAVEQKEVGESYHKAADELRNIETGYNPNLNTLDNAQQQWKDGNKLAALGQGARAIGESAIQSAPAMAGTVVAPEITIPVLGLGTTGDMANNRAKNKGLDRPTSTEVGEVAPYAAAITALDSVLPMVLRRFDKGISEKAAGQIASNAKLFLAKKVATGAAAGATEEGLTEGAQQLLQYVGEKYGTDAKMSMEDAWHQTWQAALLGGGVGSPLGGGHHFIEGKAQVANANTEAQQQSENPAPESNSIIDDLPQTQNPTTQPPAINPEETLAANSPQAPGAFAGVADYANQQTELANQQAEQERQAAAAQRTSYLDEDSSLASAAAQYGEQAGFFRKNTLQETPDDIESSLGKMSSVDDEINQLMNDIDQHHQKAALDNIQRVNAAHAEHASKIFDDLIANNSAKQSAPEISAAQSAPEAQTAFDKREAFSQKVNANLDAGIDRARDAQMPENMRDVRLLRNRYRNHLNNVVDSIDAKSGDSQNAPAFLAELQDYGSSDAIKKAITKSLDGKKLGPNQVKIVQEVLDRANSHTRDDAAIKSKWDDRAKNMLANKGNRHVEEWRNREDHQSDITTHEAALTELMTDAIQQHGIDPEKVKSAYDKYSKQYPSMNKLTAAMMSWVSANKTDSSEHLKHDRQTELLRRSSSERGSAEEQSGLPLERNSTEAIAAPERPAVAAPSERGSDSDGRESGLRQPVDSAAIDEAAHQAATSPQNNLPEPTVAQKEAGNYQKGHISVHGLDISIENPKGSKRSGVDPKGKKWETEMHSHYGYIKRTEGADGDHVDVFVGPNPNSEKVFVVDQINPDGSFDEHKVMLGYDSLLRAKTGYSKNYTKGWKVGPIKEMSIDAFKDWVKNGDTTKPLSEIAPKSGAQEVGAKTPTEANLTTGSRSLRDRKKTKKAEIPDETVAEVNDEPDDILPDKLSSSALKDLRKNDKLFKKIFSEFGVDPNSEMATQFAAGWIDADKGEFDNSLVSKRTDDMKIYGFNPIDPYYSGYLSKENGRYIERRVIPIIPKSSAVDNEAEISEQNKPLPDVNDTSVVESAVNDSSLPPILSEKKSKYIGQMAREKGIKKGSPGYEDAMVRVEDEYEIELDKAYAHISFEKYNELNNDSPESINKQAHDALREEFGVKESPALTTKGAKLAQKADVKIADFGAVIEGAKKDTASLRDTLSDKDIDTASVPLSKSFPVPEYEKLAAAGVPPEVLAFVAQLRAEIKNKPKRAGRVKQWANTVDALRSFANDLLDGSVSPESLVTAMKSYGSYVKHTVDVINIAKEILPSQIKELGNYKLAEHHYSIYLDEENVHKWVVTNTGEKGGAFQRAGKETVFNTKDEALAFIKSQVSTDDLQGKPIVKFDVWSVGGQEGVWVGKKLGNTKYIELKKFDSTREARDFIATHNDELVQLLNHKKQVGSERRAEQNERVGKDYRRGVNVTQDLFNETFGFRGVQFGNYVENDRRQQDLNNAYDGLLDLAEVLGIPPQAISLNGELGLAFGARGSGGKNAASAHYEPSDKVEPGRVVINLTKASGPGSLAHEWWHALDNYFARMGAVKDSSGSYLTELNRPKRKQIIRDKRPTIVDMDPSEFGVRPEVYDAFKAVVNTIKNDTKLFSRSEVLDGRRTKDYWTTTRELTARAFERYVIDELKTKGFESDYLATILPENAWNANEAFWGNTGESYPYPTDQEAPKTNAAYRSLFDALETKKTESGIALFSRKKSSNEPKGIAPDKVLPVVEAFLKKYKGADDVNVKIHSTAETLPGYKTGRDDNAIIEGQYDPESNTLHVVAGSFDPKNVGALEATIREELLVHKGLGLFSEEDRQSIYKSIQEAAKQSEEVARLWADTERNYSGVADDLKLSDDERQRYFAEELLGSIAQKKISPLAKGFTQIYLAVKRILVKLGILKPSDGMLELRNYVYQMGDAFERGHRAEQRDVNRDIGIDSVPEKHGDDSLIEGWKSLAQHDEAFQLPTSKAKTIEGVFKDVEGENGIRVERAPRFDENGTKAWKVNPDKNTLGLIFEKGDAVWIDVVDFKQGQDGKRVYNAVANYAHNTGKVFVGDPAGLSNVAMSRRLENMISSALKLGTTKHLRPHDKQINGSVEVPGLKWKEGDDDHNIREMIKASYESTKKQFPQLQNLFYNTNTDKFESRTTGREYTRKMLNAIAGNERSKLDESGSGVQPKSGRAANERPEFTAGSTSIERAVLSDTLLRGTREEQSKLLDRLGVQRPERLSKILYSRKNSDDTQTRSGGFSVSGLKEKGTVFGISLDGILRVWQDKMRPLLRTQEAIKGDGGSITEEQNAYLQEEAFHGKTENDLRKMKERFLEPMAEKMARYGIEREDLDMFLWARHAEERNEQIAKINPEMQDGGSGMTTAQANEVLQKAKSEGKLKHLEELASTVYSLLEEKRKISRYLAGDDVVDTWNHVYKYYVPLKGRAVDDSDGNFPRVGKGFDIRGKESLRALGRRTKPESPTLHAIKDTTEAIIRYRKNEVGNALLALVEANPNPDYWEVHDSSNPEFERKLLKKKGEEYVGSAKVINKEDYFTTKRDGKEYFIRIEDPLLMRAMKNMGPEKMNWAVQQLAKASRFLSAMCTSFNPEFVVTNFARDIQTAIINLQAEIDLHNGKAAGKQITGAMVKGVPSAMRAVYASLNGKELKGDLAEWKKSFDDFRNDGANTGWYQLKDIDQQAKELQTLINSQKKSTKGLILRTMHSISGFVENINSTVENAIRLSVYKSAVDAGITRKQAASLAKNLTVNFNRKGEIGASVNALYMFFNASVQGTASFARALGTMKVDANGKHKLNMAQKAAVGIMLAGYGLAALNRSTAGDDDDDKSWWDKVPDYEKERNIIIMKSALGGEKDGSYWKIPLPYGYNIFNASANVAEAAVSGKMGIGQAAGNILSVMLGAFSPIGIAKSNSVEGTIFRSGAPTVAKPFLDLGFNENFFGSKAHAENADFDTPKPVSHLSLRSTNEIWKWASEFMNDATGGSAYRSGRVDISPDKMGYIFNYFMGSAGKFYSDIATVGIRTAEDRKVEPKEIPFVRKFTGDVSWFQSQTEFYDRKNKINQVSEEFKSLRGDDTKEEFKKEHGDMLHLAFRAKATAKRLSDIRKHKNKIIDNKSLTEKEKDEKIEALDAKTKSVLDSFNKVYDERVKE